VTDAISDLAHVDLVIEAIIAAEVIKTSAPKASATGRQPRIAQTGEHVVVAQHQPHVHWRASMHWILFP